LPHSSEYREAHHRGKCFEVLRKLLEVDGFVSGNELGKELGVSRTTIHRCVEYLRSIGYVVESHPRYGYRLVKEDDLRYAQTYLRDLGTRIDYIVHYVETCGSTQDVAEELAKQGVPEGTVVIAEEMSAGRGRLGRKWFASRGGLWLTIVLRPSYRTNLPLLSLVAGISVVESIENLLGIDAELKWPNDVLIDGKKVCGILVEARMELDRVHYVLLGIGINVNNELPPELESFATSLRRVVGTYVPRIPLLRALLKNFDRYYASFVTNDLETIVRRYRELCSTIGRMVEVRTVDGTVLRGLALDIDRDGALLLSVEGRVVRVEAGDVYHLR